jgi:hypothetical protein
MATVSSGFCVSDFPIPADEEHRLRDLERFGLVGGTATSTWIGWWSWPS